MNEQTNTSPDPAGGIGRQRGEPWPLPDVQRARDWLLGALAAKSALTSQELDLLADLDAEVARRSGSKPRALDELLFATRHLQVRRERQIALVRRGRTSNDKEAAC